MFFTRINTQAIVKNSRLHQLYWLSTYPDLSAQYLDYVDVDPEELFGLNF